MPWPGLSGSAAASAIGVVVGQTHGHGMTGSRFDSSGRAKPGRCAPMAPASAARRAAARKRSAGVSATASRTFGTVARRRSARTGWPRSSDFRSTRRGRLPHRAYRHERRAATDVCARTGPAGRGTRAVSRARRRSASPLAGRRSSRARAETFSRSPGASLNYFGTRSPSTEMLAGSAVHQHLLRDGVVAPHPARADAA